ncbi:MAG: H-NS histone family protein [Mizugakiibacter sp.]|jgi:DNA-binding protein H-NS|uniref:H-NS histone family protein n=1 Tax=Rhodanobacteraceae TaxID=1775411 RepID=UPI002967172D|nr:H-NS histone family protein [Rhodanobacter sp. KK11]MCE5232266.1 H-NS histone family protein [Xanthomonadaceae bacterium]MDW2982420.1 H-NS histone family protein [Rhodanobacter sp. KK11]
MAVKLDGLSPKELQALIDQAQSRMESARAAHIQSVKAKIDALLKSEGLQLSDIYAGRGGKRGKRRGAGVPKYRNPADPSQTWTGYGKRPMWFQQALKRSGVTEESLLITPSTPKKSPASKAARKQVTKKPPRKATK